MRPNDSGMGKNRTNVRFYFGSLGGRAAWKLGSWVAPKLVEARALRLFATPRRAKRETAAPDVPGLRARRSSVLAGSEHLAVWEWGDGPTVLLVHGWNGLAAQLRAFVRPLVDAGYKVVAFDQPAHGRSTGRTATLLDLAEAVRTVGAQHGPIFAVVAHSLGATAAALAMNGERHGGLDVACAVLLAPPVEVPYFVRAFGAGLGLPRARVDGMLVRLQSALGRDLETLDLRRLATSMRARLLVLHDPADAEVPFEPARAAVERWPGAYLVPLHGLGHRRMLRDARVVADVVRFLSAHPRPRVFPLERAS